MFTNNDYLAIASLTETVGFELLSTEMLKHNNLAHLAQAFILHEIHKFYITQSYFRSNNKYLGTMYI